MPFGILPSQSKYSINHPFDHNARNGSFFGRQQHHGRFFKSQRVVSTPQRYAAPRGKSGLFTFCMLLSMFLFVLIVTLYYRVASYPGHQLQQDRLTSPSMNFADATLVVGPEQHGGPQDENNVVLQTSEMVLSNQRITLQQHPASRVPPEKNKESLHNADDVLAKNVPPVEKFTTELESASEKTMKRVGFRKRAVDDKSVVAPSTGTETKKDTITPQLVVKEFSTPAAFVEHRKVAEAALKKDKDVLTRIISAYVEPPLRDTIPHTGDRGDMKDEKDPGTPPDFVIPLPRRTHTPADLIKFQYPRVQTCNDMPGKFPVDRGLEISNKTGEAIVWNVGKMLTPPDFPQQEALYCPVELDPFLPWIHDVFPSQDGRRIEFIAQNKRRCRTGTDFTENVNRLVPQVALMQSISVEKLSDEEARKLAPDLWHPDDSAGDTLTAPRYRLAPYEEASPDGMFTRFICRFHITNVVGGAAVSIVLGETLSEFPFNYELVSYRKLQRALLSPKGKDTRLFWASNLRFSCPLPPDNDALREAVATGTTVLKDGTPTFFVDLVPIRTSVRYSELYLTEDMIGPQDTWELPAFDAEKRWGPNNVLPRIEASSRWTNIPICLPPEFVDAKTVTKVAEMDTFETTEVSRKLMPEVSSSSQKPHFLSACLWASSEFKTRGKNTGASTDTMNRLKEWIEFHLLVGFDHFYVYDNSGAHTNETTLEPILSLYPGKVTRIDWPSIVCNNNIPAHDSTGERSSQYAAENSCRTRFGPFTEWMAAFDTDEYFVPMGNYTNLKDVLADLGKQGTNILSLRSSRGRLRMDKSDAVGAKDYAFEKSPDKTFLEAYNCDSAGSPKPIWADRARKQIYRPDYVLYHFVHYSTVTKGYLQTYEEAKKSAVGWQRQFGESAPSERVADELEQVVLIHTKTLERDMTSNYKEQCRFDYPKKWQGCWVAYPWPPGSDTRVKNAHNEDGMEYNCHINQKVDDYWVPRLRDALAKRKTK